MKLLVVDDDPALLRLLSIRLSAEGYSVETADSGAAALKIARDFHPRAVVTDLRMDHMDGIALLEELASRWPGVPVIIMTAHGTIPDAVAATQRGAFGFITKPIDKSELLDHIARALKVSAAYDGGSDWRSHLISRSRVMDDVLRQAERVAKSQSSVLLTGESGTGKELLAQAIHKASGRSGRFVAINCGAIPAELLESELFGHAKGAFTGAANERTGLIQAADGGTLFLDEIGDMPSPLQVKLLRVLQDKEVRPVGSDVFQWVDVRIVSATNTDLRKAMKQEEFREDLYYRINVVEIHLPILEERREDIPLLVVHKLGQLAEHSPRKTFSPQAMELLVRAKWPGNVRQLFNVIEGATALANSPVVSARQLTSSLGEQAREVRSLAEARDEFTRNYLIELLQMSAGNVSKAARLAKRNRTDFYKLLTRHQVDWADFKNTELNDTHTVAR